MGTSNKKKRGKQRKVAKEPTIAGSASVNSNDLLTNLVVYTSKREAYIPILIITNYLLYILGGEIIKQRKY